MNGEGVRGVGREPPVRGVVPVRPTTARESHCPREGATFAEATAVEKTAESNWDEGERGERCDGVGERTERQSEHSARERKRQGEKDDPAWYPKAVKPISQVKRNVVVVRERRELGEIEQLLASEYRSREEGNR